MRTPIFRPFVDFDSHPFQRLQDVGFGTGDIASLIGVFNAQNHGTAQLASQQVVVQSRTHATNVQGPSGARGKTHANRSRIAHTHQVPQM